MLPCFLYLQRFPIPSLFQSRISTFRPGYHTIIMKVDFQLISCLDYLVKPVASPGFQVNKITYLPQMATSDILFLQFLYSYFLGYLHGSHLKTHPLYDLLSMIRVVDPKTFCVKSKKKKILDCAV